MNIFVIHSGEDLELIQMCKKEILANCKSANVLLLDYRTFWKPQARQLMKSAQIVLYFLGENSHKSKNIDWELKQAKKYNKPVKYIRLNDNNKLNKSLQSKDPYTQEPIELAQELHSLKELYDIIENYETDAYINLINNDMDSTTLLEQYRLFAETSEALVNRRQNVNSFYISANTALITIAATAFSLSNDWVSKLLITLVLTIPGILLNHSWYKILESYGIINSSKMKILGMLEKRLAASLYDAEWQAMSNPYNKKQYISFTDSEKNIPRIFTGIYIAIDVFCIIALAIFGIGYLMNLNG